MRIKILIPILVSTLSVFCIPAYGQNAARSLGVSVELRDEIRNSYIFVFKDTVSADDVSKRANDIASSAGGTVAQVYKTAIKGFSAKMPGEVAARLAAQNPNIAYYEPDAIAYAFPKPPWAGGGSGGNEDTSCTPQQTPWGITRVGGTNSGSSSSAWVIDTGIDLDHPDLNVDAQRSANFVIRGKNSPNDGNGHGTHVGGTIGAIDNECDVVGVVPGINLVAVRVLNNSGSGSYSGVIAGVDYVAANAQSGDVANMSLGGPKSTALNDAVIGAASNGIYFALAAGNSSVNASGHSPASAEHTNIYTVSAIDSNDYFAWFSNYGNPPVDCAAPGVNVLSTKKGGGTTTFSGTSMAAPHVAGLLLIGLPNPDGYAIDDPDGISDPICHR
jgi:subtilisin family serine protease